MNYVPAVRSGTPSTSSRKVLSADGKTKAISPEFTVVEAPALAMPQTWHNRTASKGDTCRVEWTYAGNPFGVSG